MDVEEINPQIKSRCIICSQVPTELLNKNAARLHFSQFGRVLRMVIKPRSRICIIEYNSTENAQVAILNGREYKGHILSVNWHVTPLKKKRVSKDPDPDWEPDEEIEEELKAMAGVGRDFLKSSHNLRNRAMTIDTNPLKSFISKGKGTVKRSWKAESPKKVKHKVKGMIKKSNIWTPEQLQLLNILKQPALTTEEKFKVLDARDKLIRLRTKKKTNLKNASLTVGTCPDMCPEKERLMRVVQHQIAVYEQDFSGKNMNPTLAIKQYSRSSADQETPLPHELRPVSVLQLTMGYLMHRLMNLCDTPDANLAEWYHFLWDRTRSIRKDITQQELCCQGSVVLVEQCARFHIHCSARLAGEDPSVFDQKINTENLTKCLQTLKYMYHDLSLKGEFCSNEAEFRAYIILLNLNDGNFMWEVQQLKPEIQKSPEVKFALSVYSAIDQNNFVKFFKLVHSTNYLKACILLRYFVQVRTKALSVILKSYSPRSPNTQFPLSELEKLLAFEDADSAVDFVLAYGLHLNPEETHIILDRKNFQLPELAYALDRATSVIEVKRKKTVGEIVCGGPLPSPDFQTYVPFNSFNENGVLKVTGALADVIKGSENIATSPSDDSITEDKTDSSELSSKVKPSSSVFVSNVTASERLQTKSPDPSLPFWSIKTDSAPASTNIFRNKSDTHSANIFSNKATKSNESSSQQSMFKSPLKVEQKNSSIFGQQKSTFSEEPQKSSIFNPPAASTVFGDQPKPSSQQNNASIFAKPSSSAFTEQKQSSIFGGQPKPLISSIEHPGIFGGEQPKQIIKPGGFAFDVTLKKDTPVSHGGFSFDLKSSNNLKEKPTLINEEGANVTSHFSDFITSAFSSEKAFKENATSSITKQPINTTFNSQTNLFKGEKIVFKSPLATSAANEEKIKAAELIKARLEELERQKKLAKEEQLRLELEEKKRREELLRKQKLEEEKKERERKRRQLQKQKEMEEFARKMEIELLMQDLLERVEKKVKKDRLKEIANNITKYKMRLFVEKWQKKSVSSKRKRQAMDQNPIWLPQRTANAEASELYTDTQDLNLLNIKRYKCGKSSDILLPIEDKIVEMDVKIIYKILMKSYMKIYQRLQKEMFWKVTVSLPDFREFKIGLNHVERILTDIFQWKDRYGGTSVVNQYIGENHLNYAIEKKQGVHPFDSNSNGLIFISYDANELLLERIKEAFKNYPKFASTPVVVIFINNNLCNSPNGLLEALDNNSHISNYEFLTCKFTNLDIINTIDKSLVLLAELIQTPPSLELNTLQSFLNINMGTELWKRISTYALWNSTYKKCLKSPNVVISLYNEAVERLKGIVLDSSSLQYPDFPDEFDKRLLEQIPDVLPCDYKYFPSFWKSESYRCLLINTLNSLQLPKYQAMWPPQNEKELERDIFNYCSDILENPDKAFFKVMAIILQNIDPTLDFNKIEKVVWTNVIEVIALEKFQETNLGLQHTEFYNKSIFQQLFVVYNKEKLNSHINDEWYYLKNPVVQAEIKRDSSIKKTKVKKKVKEFQVYDNDDDFDLDALEKSVRESSEKLVCGSSKLKELRDFMDDLADLEESMAIQEKICANFEEKIKSALER